MRVVRPGEKAVDLGWDVAYREGLMKKKARKRFRNVNAWEAYFGPQKNRQEIEFESPLIGAMAGELKQRLKHLTFDMSE